MGSKEIWNLEYRHAFAFIGQIGTINGSHEKRGKNVKEEVHIANIF